MASLFPFPLSLLSLFVFFLLPSVRGAAGFCRRNICLNGGTCIVREDDSFGCRCPTGYGGLICEVDCGCVNGDCDPDSRECTCYKGWVGEKCDIEAPKPASTCRKDLDCPSDQRCVEASETSKGLECREDPCHSSPCAHGASCTISKGKQQCECVLGYRGPRCEEDVNECLQNPCRNGGTCVNMLGGFNCICADSYSGDVCENSGCDRECGGACVATDEGGFRCACANGTLLSPSRPCTTKSPSQCGDCLNGGKCVPVTADKSVCLCHPDFFGPGCEQRQLCIVNGHSCENGGRCIRGVGAAYCECTEQYEGENCERRREGEEQETTTLNTTSSSTSTSTELTTTTRLDVCADVRCANGGYCLISNGAPKCACPARFSGTWCETAQHSACDTQHCENGGTCSALGDVEDSWECVCMEGFGGIHCEDPIHHPPSTRPTTPVGAVGNDSESSTVRPSPVPTPPSSSPLPPSSTTQPSTTVAPQTRPEIRCGQCVHSSRCVETLEGAVCVCHDGFTGPTCTRATKSCSSLSCPSGQSCLHRSSLLSSLLFCGCPTGSTGEDCSASSSVTLGRDSLFVHHSPHVMIGSSSGPLPYSLSFSFRTTVPDVHIITGEDLFGTRLFSLFIKDGLLSVNVSSTTYLLLPQGINDGEWYSVQLNKTDADVLVSLSSFGRLLFTRSLPRSPSFDVFSTRLGKMSPSLFFIGCISDFFVDGERRDLSILPRAVALTAGCARASPCTSSPCGAGSCTDLWDSFSCRCPSPLLPPLCVHSLPPSTFGHDGRTSEAHFQLSPEITEKLKYHTRVSVLLRTRQSDGVVAVIGEHVEGDSDASDLATFLSLEIVNGTLHARARVVRKTIIDVDSETRMDDNEEHLVVLTRDKNMITLSIDGMERGEASLETRFDYPLFPDSLIVGSANGSAKGAFTSSRFFKGSMQDLRVNDVYSAVMHDTTLDVRPVGTLLHSHNILQGVVSDDVCSSLVPCRHGNCSNGFNEYSCACEREWTGRNCDERDHCTENECPEGAVCVSQGDGYTCTAPAHFVEASFADLELSHTPVVVESISFSLRTHSDRAHIITLGDGYSVSLVKGLLSVGPPNTAFLLRGTAVNTGTWHNITIHNNIVRIGNTTHGIPRQASLSLPSVSLLRIGSSLLATSFSGCINDIRIAETAPLSFFPETKAKSSGNLWMSIKRHRIHAGSCLSVPQCGAADACLNGASCEDKWNKRGCVCAPGWEGERCEKEVDECSSLHCLHGNCIDRFGTAECMCHSGFSGASCDSAIDPCADHSRCLNDGVCRRSNASSSGWNCLCLPGYHGTTCALKGEVGCDENSCSNGGICVSGPSGFSCECVSGHSGELCEVTPSPCESSLSGGSPCGHHGVCERNANQPRGFSCKCLPGYTGWQCDQLVDGCSSSSCFGHGKCSPSLNSTLCQCTPPWTGRSCSVRAGGCALIPCSNDGECVENDDGSTSCTCRQYYLGEGCEVAGSCLSSPCQNGRCIQKTPTSHSCECEEGFRGERCEKEMNMCESVPCANGATCTSSRGTFTCQCAPGFDGVRCDHDVDDCAPSPCQNGGSCVDRVAAYECLCGDSFSGRNCEEDVDECAMTGKCINGRCTNTHGAFICQCSIGFVGRGCSLRNPCVPDSLNKTTHLCVHGDCSRPVARWEGGREWAEHDCSCHPGYTGPTCATKLEAGRLSVSYVLGPLVAVLVVLCILGCALLLFVLKGKGALHGHYSPSQQEDAGRFPMGTMLKLPPEERLI